MHNGKFFVFEGIDGAGLTTQASLLKDWFEKQGYMVFLTKEPTEGPIGAQIRMALSKRLNMGTYALALSFAADRMDHLETEVMPKIKDGIIVISDRYYLSSYAYQSLDIELEWIMQIHSKCRKPDTTFLLDVSATICKKRMERMRWHVELYEELEKLETIRRNFLSIARELKKSGEKIKIVDGNRPIAAVHKEIVRKVKETLQEEGSL